MRNKKKINKKKLSSVMIVYYPLAKFPFLVVKIKGKKIVAKFEKKNDANFFVNWWNGRIEELRNG